MAVYWGIKHEEFCKSWLTAGVKDQFKIYHQLHGVLYMMSEIIANRYFSIPNSRQAEYFNIVIEEVFLKLSKFNPNSGTAYTFCSMVIKHKYYDIVTSRGMINQPQLEYVDNYEPIDTDTPMYETKEEIDVEAISKHLQTLETKIKESILKDIDNRNVDKIKEYNNQLICLDYCKEYLLRFNDFNTSGVIEYIENNSNVGIYKIGCAIQELFGSYITVDEKLYRKEKKIRTELIKKEIIRTPKQEAAHKWYLKYGKERLERISKMPAYIAKKKAYIETHAKEIAAYKKAWQIANREKSNQQSLAYYYRKKEKNAKLLSIITDATPIDGSSSVGMLAGLPEYINTEDQNNAMVTAKTCEMALVV